VLKRFMLAFVAFVGLIVPCHLRAGAAKGARGQSLCKSGAERERDLGRLDADVEHINEAIAARCG
jgi:hypothetical protein